MRLEAHRRLQVIVFFAAAAVGDCADGFVRFVGVDDVGLGRYRRAVGDHRIGNRPEEPLAAHFLEVISARLDRAGDRIGAAARRLIVGAGGDFFQQVKVAGARNTENAALVAVGRYKDLVHRCAARIRVPIFPL